MLFEHTFGNCIPLDMDSARSSQLKLRESMDVPPSRSSHLPLVSCQASIPHKKQRKLAGELTATFRAREVESYFSRAILWQRTPCTICLRSTRSNFLGSSCRGPDDRSCSLHLDITFTMEQHHQPMIVATAVAFLRGSSRKACFSQEWTVFVRWRANHLVRLTQLSLL